MSRLLEICCTSLQNAVDAQQGGADRIELCARLHSGGLTPSSPLLRKVRATVHIPIFVLIRPRGGHFHYSEAEWARLLRQIDEAKANGADGIVCGVLLQDGHVDLNRTKQMVEAAAPLPLTFHRAFDLCQDPLEAVDGLAEAGVRRILTSGQGDTALKGIENLRAFAQRAAGRLEILAGGGVRPENLPVLLEVEGLREFHSSARGSYAGSIRRTVAVMKEMCFRA